MSAISQGLFISSAKPEEGPECALLAIKISLMYTELCL